jgi:hypothetical protein
VTPPTIPGVLYWGKLPVPFVAAWSSEDAVRIAPDPLLARKPAMFRSGRRGLGTPMFGKMDESRVRRVIIRRLCQVCAGSLGSAGYVLDTIKGSVGGDPLLSEPLPPIEPGQLRCQRCARGVEDDMRFCPTCKDAREDERRAAAPPRRTRKVKPTTRPCLNCHAPMPIRRGRPPKNCEACR